MRDVEARMADADMVVFTYCNSLQVRDDVVNASQLAAAAQCEAAADDVTSHVTTTSRRLSDVAVHVHNVSTLVQQQFGDSSLDAIVTVKQGKRR